MEGGGVGDDLLVSCPSVLTLQGSGNRFDSGGLERRGGLSEVWWGVGAKQLCRQARRRSEWQIQALRERKPHRALPNETNKGGKGDAADSFAKDIKDVIPQRKEGRVSRWMPLALSPQPRALPGLEVEDPELVSVSIVAPPEPHHEPVSDKNG